MDCSVSVNNLRIDQGSRLRFTFRVLDNGSPADLSGYTARMQIRASVSSTDVLAEYTTANNMLVISPGDSTVTITVPSSETEDYNWTTGVYDLEIVSGSNDAIRISEGWVKVSPQVTR